MTPLSCAVLPKSNHMIMCHPRAVWDQSWLLTAIPHALCLCFCWDFSRLMLSAPQSSSLLAALTWIWSSWLCRLLSFLCLVLSPTRCPWLGHIPLGTHTFVNSWSGLKYFMINLVFSDDFLPTFGESQTSEIFVCCFLIWKYSQEYLQACLNSPQLSYFEFSCDFLVLIDNFCLHTWSGWYLHRQCVTVSWLILSQ